MQGGAPPPFEVGHTYVDGKGEYTVLSIRDKTVRLQRADGSEETADLDLKARIHKRIMTERMSGYVPHEVLPRKSRAGTLEWFYEMIAEKLTEHAQNSSDFMSHDALLNALLDDQEGGPLLRRFSEEDPEQEITYLVGGQQDCLFQSAMDS